MEVNQIYCIPEFPMSTTNSKFQARNTPITDRGLTGLPNIGNTCFLNSVIQCLSNTRPLLEYILSNEYLGEIRNPTKSLVIECFAELIQNIWNDRKSSVNPVHLKHAVELYAPRFSGYSQHDAQEFLKYLLEGLHQELNRAKSVHDSDKDSNHSTTSFSATESWQTYLKTDNSKVVNIFGGLLKSVLKCTQCGFSSTVYEPFWDLSLSIPIDSSHRIQNLHLNHCLNLFTKEETLDGLEKPLCEKCKMKQICVKRISIQKFPSILVIHLKRFSGNGITRKIDQHIDYPLVGLDLGEYSADTQFRSISYNLYGLINHYGTCQFGHYTACCKHPYSGRWHRFNDRSVSPINTNQADKAEAYILFYEAVV
ncbi:ubiquitin carboxyl-terminal hydrolase 2 [Macrosteles quadrilineatus]|uniref:ubiquitin carboxyl-terminal hydrolase 2 n=1 Tax=Macrosteles quadrilineatus TaxID=74068 RepID=UPI0023E3213F|nr:ubiquitin carboxyl-terminal hydrolase 2 [Macrosteles quadrilineatus]